MVIFHSYVSLPEGKILQWQWGLPCAWPRALWPNATVALENYINQELTEKLQRDLPSPFNSAVACPQEELTWFITRLTMLHGR